MSLLEKDTKKLQDLTFPEGTVVKFYSNFRGKGTEEWSTLTDEEKAEVKAKWNKPIKTSFYKRNKRLIGDYSSLILGCSLMTIGITMFFYTLLNNLCLCQ